MKRVVSLYLPHWSTDRLRRRLGSEAPRADQPLVLIGRDARRRIVFSADRAAQALGLRSGTPATQARALCADLVAHDADPDADAAALERLAVWALRLYAPLVAADPPDGLVLDVTGACGLKGGEAGLLKDLVRRLEAAGFEARAAMAGSWGAAHALARWGGEPLIRISSEETGRALAPLPVRALRVCEETALALGKVGIDTIGALEGRPRAPLARRFGTELLQRLDQAYGRCEEPITPVESPTIPATGRSFLEPLSAPQTLARHVLKLAQALCVRLEIEGVGARILDLKLDRVDARVETVRIRVSRPSRDALRLARLLCEKLEAVDPGFGIERMTLSAPGAEPLRPEAAGVLGAPPSPDVASLIDTLANRLGPERLYRAAPAESDIPERSVRRIRPQAPPLGEGWPARWPRPTRLLERPERMEATALLPDQPPAAFTWRGVRRRVRRADGPERIFGEWWLRDEELFSVRDYFQLEDDAGERFWVFRSGDGEQPATGDLSWYMHGVFA